MESNQTTPKEQQNGVNGSTTSTPSKPTATVATPPPAPVPVGNAWSRSSKSLAEKLKSSPAVTKTPSVSPPKDTKQTSDNDDDGVKNGVESATNALSAWKTSETILEKKNIRENLVYLSKEMRAGRMIIDEAKYLIDRKKGNCGLSNLGNTCFLNAVAQSLFAIDHVCMVLSYVEDNIVKDEERKACPILLALASLYAAFATQLPSLTANKNKALNVILDAFFTSPAMINQFEGRGFQQDAQEFLHWLLDALNEEQLSSPLNKETASMVTSVSAATIEAKQSIGDEDEWVTVSSVKKKKKPEISSVGDISLTPDTFVNEIFQGKVQHILIDPDAGKRITLQGFRCLQLDIQEKKVDSIQTALNNYFSTGVSIEESDGNDGDSQEKMSVSIRLDSLPSVLILHVKRFYFDVANQMPIKVSKRIQYSEDLFIQQRHMSSDLIASLKESRGAKSNNYSVKYTLSSVISHLGSSALGGHYICNSRDPTVKNHWHNFNDNLMKQIYSKNEILSAQDTCYLLFYEKSL